MYKVTGRSGQFVYTREQMTKSASNSEWDSEFKFTYDCKNWEYSIENRPPTLIVPRSVADGIAKDVCNR